MTFEHARQGLCCRCHGKDGARTLLFDSIQNPFMIAARPAGVVGTVRASVRHFCSGSLALASLNHTCRNLVPTFPQRSPPSLLTTAACGGLRSTPDCRPRRAFLHLSYSSALLYGPALLVTQYHKLTHAVQQRAWLCPD